MVKMVLPKKIGKWERELDFFNLGGATILYYNNNISIGISDLSKESKKKQKRWQVLRQNNSTGATKEFLLTNNLRKAEKFIIIYMKKHPNG